VADRARLDYLESSVANLLAGLHNNDLPPAPAPATAPSIAPLAAPVVAPVTAPHPATTAFTNTATPALSDPPTIQRLGQVRFDNSPEVNFISPHSYSSRPETISPSREYDAGRGGKHKDNEKEAEERLASATRDGFEPPFQALVYQPSVWQNREGSKRSSPLPDEQPVHPSSMPAWGVRDEPVTSGVIDLATARILYTLSVLRRPSLHLPHFMSDHVADVWALVLWITATPFCPLSTSHFPTHSPQSSAIRRSSLQSWQSPPGSTYVTRPHRTSWTLMFLRPSPI
jgi:hypothetical protein